MKKTSLLIQELEEQKHNIRLQEIYMDEGLVSSQIKRYMEAIKRYETIFCEGDDVEIFSAPGRSEIGGNHTDHQQGMVLAASIHLDAIAVTGFNSESLVKVLSEGYDLAKLSLSELNFKDEEAGSVTALIKGMLQGLKNKGYHVDKGFNVYVTSDVLSGSGLSSSASFEVLMGTIVSGLFYEGKINPVEIAQIAQYAENVYFKKPCGLMDQMASSMGGLIHIDFKDVGNPVVNKVNVDFNTYGHSLCIVDTKGSHGDMTDDYALIPSEMRKVAAFFGKKVLREVDTNEFYNNISQIRSKIGDRPVLRAIHFFEEEERVLNQVKALQEGNFHEFMKLIKASGNSSFQYLQNIYTNRDVENQSVSIGLAMSEVTLRNQGVSRVHGGGFAGTIQAFVSNQFVEEYKRVMEGVFGENACMVLKVRQYGGIKALG